MNQKEILLVFSYIYNNRIRLEQELQEMQARYRCRELSTTECIELALLKERFSTFLEVTGHIRALLKLGERPKGNTCLICGADIPETRQVCKNCCRRYKRIV